MRSLIFLLPASLLLSCGRPSSPADRPDASPRMIPANPAPPLDLRRLSHFPSSERVMYDTEPGPWRLPGRWVRRSHGPGQLFSSWRGQGIPVDPAVMTSAAAAREVARAFFSGRADLFPEGIRPPLAVAHDGLVGRTRLVTFVQHAGGLPVESSGAWVAFNSGRLSAFGLRVFPGTTPATGTTEVSEASAILTAEVALGTAGRTAPVESVALRLVPMIQGDTVSLRRARRVSFVPRRGERWEALVAADGALLSLKDRAVSTSARLHLRHHDRPITLGFVTSPAAHLTYTTDGTTLYADEEGGISTATSDGTVLLTASSRYITVVNEEGPPLEQPLGPLPDQALLTWEVETLSEQAQLDAQVFVTNCREAAHTIADDVPWVDDPLTLRVNAEGSCNAMYTGEIIFLKGSDQCTNAALIEDVAYHEYGHGFHFNSIIEGMGAFDGAVGEGFADLFSALITRDHNMAPEFLPGAPNLRDLEPDRVWPWDLNIFNEVHENGLIVGSTLWDLWTALEAARGKEEGTLLMKRIYGQILKTTTDILSLFENILLADDDDGDLNNGTPNLCAIVPVFAAHGLLDLLTFVPPGVHHIPEVNSPTRLSLTFSEVFAQCAPLANITRGTFRYSFDDGQTWQEHDIVTTGARRFDVVLPAPGKPGRVLYAFTLHDGAGGRTYTLPANAAEPYYMLYAGPLYPIHFDDFEEEDPGWTHTLVDGIDQPGADDWQRGTPRGEAWDPAGAYSGEFAWGNDLSDPERWNGAYKSNVINRLTSPAFDCSGFSSVRLQFRRWLVIEDGTFDHARIYVNDQVVWSNRASVEGKRHHHDREWVLFDLDISPWAAGKSEVTITWELQSDGGNEYGGWTIDDFALMTTDDSAAPPSVEEGCSCRLPGRPAPLPPPGLLLLAAAALIRRRRIRP